MNTKHHEREARIELPGLGPTARLEKGSGGGIWFLYWPLGPNDYQCHWSQLHCSDEQARQLAAAMNTRPQQAPVRTPGVSEAIVGLLDYTHASPSLSKYQQTLKTYIAQLEAAPSPDGLREALEKAQTIFKKLRKHLHDRHCVYVDETDLAECKELIEEGKRLIKAILSTPASPSLPAAPSLEAQLHQIRMWRAESGCDVERIKAWWNNGKPEKTANTAFTAGPERQMAYLLEHAAPAQPDLAGIREALEFYADPECYKPQERDGCPVRGTILLQSDIQADGGERARKALSATPLSRQPEDAGKEWSMKDLNLHAAVCGIEGYTEEHTDARLREYYVPEIRKAVNAILPSLPTTPCLPVKNTGGVK